MTNIKNQYEVERWVNDNFNFIGGGMFDLVVKHSLEEGTLDNITPFTVGDTVEYPEGFGEVVEVYVGERGNIEATILPEGGSELDLVTVSYDELYHTENFPMWDTLFEPKTELFTDWILDHDREVAEAGFMILQDYDKDILFLGINGAGYDFYEKHWNKLYELYMNK